MRAVRQGEGGEGEDGRAGARRRDAAAAPRLTFTGNHVANYSRGRERGATQPGTRQRVRSKSQSLFPYAALGTGLPSRFRAFI